MSHALLLATIVSLLLCPFRCMGGLVAGIASAEGEQVQGSVCSCCRTQHATDSPADERVPGESEDDCCACLCEGAILSEDDGSLVALDDSPDFAGLSPNIGRAGLLDTEPGLTRRRGDTPPPDTRPAGRHLLFAVQSLLL